MCHVLEARKLQEILGYLLLHATRPHSREVLASLFWSESTTAQSKKNLRQALWQIQSALEELRHKGEPPLFVVDNDWVELHINEGVWVDCIELEKTYRLYHGQPKGQVTPTALPDLRAAADLYTADLLEGCYQDWCLFERERLQNIYLELLGQLIESCERAGEYQPGIEYAKRVLDYDRTHEATHQHLMHLYYLQGDRTASLRQYKRCCEELQKEFGVSPSRRTTDLYRQIQGKDAETAPRGFALPPPDVTSTSREGHRIKDALERLDQLVTLLGNIQAETREQVRVIENMLKVLSQK